MDDHRLARWPVYFEVALSHKESEAAEARGPLTRQPPKARVFFFLCGVLQSL